MQDALIEQIVSRVSSLTDAQVSAMNSATLPQEAIIEANDVAGEETRAIMTQFADSVDAGVYSVARTAILGIMAKGKVPDEVSAILVRAWTDIVEPLDEGTFPNDYVVTTSEGTPVMASELASEPVVDAPHTPTEEELADLGAPVESVPNFSANLVSEDGASYRTVLLRKLTGNGPEGYLEVGTNSIWLADTLTDIKPYPEEVGTPALVDAPLDIQEGEINV